MGWYFATWPYWRWNVKRMSVPSQHSWDCSCSCPEQNENACSEACEVPVGPGLSTQSYEDYSTLYPPGQIWSILGFLFWSFFTEICGRQWKWKQNLCICSLYTLDAFPPLCMLCSWLGTLFSRPPAPIYLNFTHSSRLIKPHMLHEDFFYEFSPFPAAPLNLQSAAEFSVSIDHVLGFFSLPTCCVFPVPCTVLGHDKLWEVFADSHTEEMNWASFFLRQGVGCKIIPMDSWLWILPEQ